MFRRTIDLLGIEGFERLRSSFVVIAGLGGVGSHVATALARSGIGRLRLIDYDEVSISSLNRHAIALARHVGIEKAELMHEWIESLGSETSVEVAKLFIASDTLDQVFEGSPDLVIDAIDTLGPKTSFLEGAVRRGLPVIASMGASSRTDPTAIRIADISETSQCPLAKHLRKWLRRRGIESGITTVYSTEKPQPQLPPDEDDKRLDRGRIRNRLPSLSTLPGIFGYTIANEAILRLSGFSNTKS